jgi:mono/diheme cytochrome c family protein
MNSSTVASMFIAVTTLSFTASAGNMEEKLVMGKLEYEAKCAVCHGVTGKGDGPFTNQLKMPSTDLTQLAKNNDGVFPETEVYMALDGRSEVQAHGPREMPIYGEVYLAEGPAGTTAKEREPRVDERLRALIAYLKTMQK